MVSNKHRMLRGDSNNIYCLFFLLRYVKPSVNPRFFNQKMETKFIEKSIVSAQAKVTSPYPTVLKRGIHLCARSVSSSTYKWSNSYNILIQRNATKTKHFKHDRYICIMMSHYQACRVLYSVLQENNTHRQLKLGAYHFFNFVFPHFLTILFRIFWTSIRTRFVWTEATHGACAVLTTGNLTDKTTSVVRPMASRPLLDKSGNNATWVTLSLPISFWVASVMVHRICVVVRVTESTLRSTLINPSRMKSRFLTEDYRGTSLWPIVMKHGPAVYRILHDTDKPAR